MSSFLDGWTSVEKKFFKRLKRMAWIARQPKKGKRRPAKKRVKLSSYFCLREIGGKGGVDATNDKRWRRTDERREVQRAEATAFGKRLRKGRLSLLSPREEAAGQTDRVGTVRLDRENGK